MHLSMLFLLTIKFTYFVRLICDFHSYLEIKVLLPDLAVNKGDLII